MANKRPALRDIEGVETWVELHVRPVHRGKVDLTKEAIVWTQAGNSYVVSIEGTHIVRPTGNGYVVCTEGTHIVGPTQEALRTVMWQAGDWVVAVSGVALEHLQAGDLLVQERNASKRPERKRKFTAD